MSGLRPAHSHQEHEAEGAVEDRAADRDLLRMYEPVLRFTAGELFFPCAVDGYVRRASLWKRTRRDADGPMRSQLLAKAGSLAPDALGMREAGPDEILFLRFVQEPLKGIDYERWRLHERPPFRAPGRLARVGLVSRLADSFFSLSLLLRGRVPGGTAAAAARQYRAILAESPGYVYHGRVVRQDGYTVLHYHFFYCMNDWRTSFAGVNEHESDWEQILIYLADNGAGVLAPAWIAFAAHDYSGDDLRRRWDDPEIAKLGDHPVVYTAAGSHAGYFQPGEYLAQVDVPYLQGVRGAAYAIRRFWRDTLRQGNAETFVSTIEGLTRIPFVDYARGDGLAIGPGQAATWTPVLIDDAVPWVDGYRGLWGLDTGDILGGERAPAGPKYTRTGAVRQSWYDPLGWAGLHKVAPPAESAEVLQAQSARIEAAIAQIDREVAAARQTLPGLDLEVKALHASPPLGRLRERRARDLTQAEQEMNALLARRVELEETLEACARYLEGLRSGARGDPQAHIRHKQTPDAPGEARRGRLAELWAALSTSVLLFLAIGLLLSGTAHPVLALLFVVLAVVMVDSILNRRVERLLLNTTVGLAIVTSLVLIYEFFWPLTLALVAGLAVMLVVENVRELRGR